MSYRIDRFAMLLKDATRALVRRFEQRSTEWGLSATQWRVIGLVLREGPMTQAALAEHLDVEPMSVSRLVDRLEASGWVRRCPHPDDRRARIVEPTDQARAASPEVTAILERIYDEALAKLDDDQRRAFHHALLCVIDTLNAPQSAPETATTPAASDSETVK